MVFALGEWSVQWLYAEMEPRSIDPITLTWWMHHRVDAAALPPGRVVVQFDYTGPERVTAWIVLDRGEASVCNQHPGYDSDVIVTCTSSALSGVFNGVESWSHALATGAIRIDGPPFARARGGSSAARSHRSSPPRRPPLERPRPSRRRLVRPRRVRQKVSLSTSRNRVVLARSPGGRQSNTTVRRP